MERGFDRTTVQLMRQTVAFMSQRRLLVVLSVSVVRTLS